MFHTAQDGEAHETLKSLYPLCNKQAARSSQVTGGPIWDGFHSQCFTKSPGWGPGLGEILGKVLKREGNGEP